MRLWRPKTFRSQLFIPIGAFLLAFSVVLGGAGYYQYRTQLQEEFVKRGRALAADLASSSELGVFGEEERLLNAAIRGIIGESDVAAVFVYNEKGKLLVGKRTGIGGKAGNAVADTLPADILARFGKARQVMEAGMPAGSHLREFVAPIFSSGPVQTVEESILNLGDTLGKPEEGGQRLIGAARILLSLEGINRHLAGVLWIWLVVTGAFLTLGVGMVYVLVGRLTAPVEVLTKGAEQITAGNLDLDIPVTTEDEVGRLAQSFNNMAAALKRTMDEREEVALQLRDLNVHLEYKVAQRTRELGEKNAELQRANEKIKEADRLKSEFLANMSHELRTPLNSIMGFAKVILKGIDGPTTEAQQRDLATIYNSGSHLLSLINDILDLSKIEAGKTELVMEEIDVPEMVRGVLSTTKGLVKEKPIQLVEEVAADLPRIMADRTRIRQCLLNLVSNAAKFTDRGSITIRATTDNGYVVLAVQDTGIGIKPEDQARIFQEFVQVDSSSTRKEGGTGLGLAITKKCVEMHGGTIQVQSAHGMGSTFTVRLPVRQPAAEKVQAPRSEPVGPTYPDGRQPVILAVDDEPEALFLYRRILEREGYKLLTVTEGAKAMPVARLVRPHAIILDILMPDKDGWEILQELKKDPATGNIPVLVCTVVSDKSRGLSLGADGYLVKPVDDEELLTALKQIKAASETGWRRGGA